MIALCATIGTMAACVATAVMITIKRQQNTVNVCMFCLGFNTDDPTTIYGIQENFATRVPLQ